MRTVSGRTVYVSVTDLSRSGVCVIRRGGIDVDPNDEVMLEFSDSELNQKLALPSRVEWVKASTYSTTMGLNFLKGPLLPGTMLDPYLDQFLSPRGGA